MQLIVFSGLPGTGKSSLAEVIGRSRHIPGWYELTWQEVVSLQARFEPWQEDRLIVDAVRPFAENVTAVLAYLAQS